MFASTRTPDTTPSGWIPLPGRRPAVGGTDIVRYFLSGEHEDEPAPWGCPTSNVAASTPRTPDPRLRGPPEHDAEGFAAGEHQLGDEPETRHVASTSFINLGQRLRRSRNDGPSLVQRWRPGLQDHRRIASWAVGLGTPLNGCRAWTPGYTFQENVAQNINRFIGSLNATGARRAGCRTARLRQRLYRPRDDNLLFRSRGTAADFSTNRDGFAEAVRANIRNFTVDLGTTATTRQAVAEPQVHRWRAVRLLLLPDLRRTGRSCPRGRRPRRPAPRRTSRQRPRSRRRSGLFVEEAAAINDRLFLTAAVRTDQNSAFGTNFQSVVYPKASLSLDHLGRVVLPEGQWLNQLRLRSSFGSSGVQPGPNDALRTTPPPSPTRRVPTSRPSSSAQLGNPDLKPERSTEFEAGFESKLFDEPVPSTSPTTTRATRTRSSTRSCRRPSARLVDVTRQHRRSAEPGLGAPVRQLFDRGRSRGHVAQRRRTPTSWSRWVRRGGQGHPADRGHDPGARGISPLRPVARAITAGTTRTVTGSSPMCRPSLNEVSVADSVELPRLCAAARPEILTNGFDLLNRPAPPPAADRPQGRQHGATTPSSSSAAQQTTAGRSNASHDASFGSRRR